MSTTILNSNDNNQVITAKYGDGNDEPTKGEDNVELDFANQEDPFFLLLKYSLDNFEALSFIESAAATLVADCAKGASKAVEKGDEKLKVFITQLQAITGTEQSDKDRRTNISSALQVAQTEVANSNQEYSNTMQVGNTRLSALGSTKPNVLAFCKVGIEVYTLVNDLTKGWSQGK